MIKKKIVELSEFIEQLRNEDYDITATQDELTDKVNGETEYLFIKKREGSS